MDADADSTLPHLKAITQAVIGAAFEVSNTLGPGFLEKVYERALEHELKLRGRHTQRQAALRIHYKNPLVGDYVADLVVDHAVVVELKCVDALRQEHVAQCLNYLKATGLELALLLNFQTARRSSSCRMFAGGSRLISSAAICVYLRLILPSRFAHD